MYFVDKQFLFSVLMPTQCSRFIPSASGVWFGITYSFIPNASGIFADQQTGIIKYPQNTNQHVVFERVRIILCLVVVRELTGRMQTRVFGV